MSIDLNAFNKFFIDYQQRFVHFACTYVHDEAVAEDFVVESMMYYWENKDRLSADTNIPAYVLTTIKHKVGSINSIFYFLHKAAEPFNCLEQGNLA